MLVLLILSMDFYSIIIAVSGSIILSLLTFIGYFLKQFALSVKELKDTVDNLKTMLYSESEKIVNIREKVNEKFLENSEKLHEHEDRIDNQDKRLTVIETKICKK